MCIVITIVDDPVPLHSSRTMISRRKRTMDGHQLVSNIDPVLFNADILSS